MRILQNQRAYSKSQRITIGVKKEERQDISIATKKHEKKTTLSSSLKRRSKRHAGRSCIKHKYFMAVRVELNEPHEA